MSELCKQGRAKFQVRIDALPPHARTVLTIDVGHRNLGLCVYDVRDDVLLRLEWVDLARHPDAETPSGHEVAGIVVAYLQALPERLALDLCVIEQQPILTQQETILLFMVSFFCGVVQSPITAAVILLEMTSARFLTLPLITASIVAYEVSRVVCPNALYEALAETFLARMRGDLPHS